MSAVEAAYDIIVATITAHQRPFSAAIATHLTTWAIARTTQQETQQCPA